MPTEFITRGPLFDGRAKRAVEAYIIDVEVEVAQFAVNEVEKIMMPHSKSGQYVHSIQTERQLNDIAVTDGGIIYGPWLEGVSSRNKTTRFKGYAQFRRAAQSTRMRAGEVAESLLESKYIGRMQ